MGCFTFSLVSTAFPSWLQHSFLHHKFLFWTFLIKILKQTGCKLTEPSLVCFLSLFFGCMIIFWSRGNDNISKKANFVGNSDIGLLFLVAAAGFAWGGSSLTGLPESSIVLFREDASVPPFSLLSSSGCNSGGNFSESWVFGKSKESACSFSDPGALRLLFELILLATSYYCWRII